MVIEENMLILGAVFWRGWGDWGDPRHKSDVRLIFSSDFLVIMMPSSSE